MFNTLVELLSKPDISPQNKGAIVDQIQNFISDPQHIELAI
jgi:hypothetical protein